MYRVLIEICNNNNSVAAHKVACIVHQALKSTYMGGGTFTPYYKYEPPSICQDQTLDYTGIASQWQNDWKQHKGHCPSFDKR